MRFLITTGGSHGDVHPFIAVGRALAAREHHVRFCVHPHFRRDVEAAGLEFAPVGESLDLVAEMRNPDLMHPTRGGKLVMDMIVRTAPEGIERVRSEIASYRPDALVAHHIALGAVWAAEEARVPCAVGVLAPMMWLGRRDPIAPFQRFPGALGRLAGKALGLVAWTAIGAMYDRAFARVRDRLGFAPEKRPFTRSFHAGDVNLGLFSPHFRAPLPGDPPNGVVTGFPFYDGIAKHPALDADIERFLGDGEPPIVFTLGTAAVHAAGNFYEVAAEACRRLGRRGVLLVGPDGSRPKAAPPYVTACEYAPFSLLLPRGAATVHHGGIGSTSQALRAGRPMVVVAHAHDQFNNALHAMALGCAALVPRHRLTVKRLVRALAAMLEDPEPAVAARRIGGKLAAEDGASRAADEIERIGALSASRAGTAIPARR